MRRRGRRLLITGSALAVAAAAAIVAVARPPAGGLTGLPPNSVSLIDSAGGPRWRCGERSSPSGRR
jgi:hypothetical protein